MINFTTTRLNDLKLQEHNQPTSLQRDIKLITGHDICDICPVQRKSCFENHKQLPLPQNRRFTLLLVIGVQ